MFYHRPRRLRQSTAMRNLVAQNRLAPADLILPVFVNEGADQPSDIYSMPGVQQHSMDSLKAAAHDAVSAGVGGIMLFGVPERLDAQAAPVDPQGILNLAIAEVVAEVGNEMVVMANTCLDEFTDHGHCGVLDDDGVVDNDATNAIYARMALAQASRRACDLPVGHDGRSGRSHSSSTGNSRTYQHGNPGLLGKIRFGVLWSVPRGR